jgi:hypothetical protein
LLAQKEQLVARLNQNQSDNERAEIEAMLAKIDTALKLLDSAEPGDPT